MEVFLSFQKENQGVIEVQKNLMTCQADTLLHTGKSMFIKFASPQLFDQFASLQVPKFDPNTSPKVQPFDPNANLQAKPFDCHSSQQVHSFRPRVKSSYPNAKKQKEKRQFTCEECGQSYKSYHGYYEHKKSKHGPEQIFICETCGQHFKSKYGLSLHRRNKHENVFKYVCPVCDKGYNQTVQYKAHVRNHKTATEHASDNQYSCEFCGKTFPTSTHLSQHFSSCAYNPEVDVEAKPHVCDVCDARFNKSYHLKYHIMGKHQEPSYECHVCDKKFSWRSSLKVHLKTHGDVTVRQSKFLKEMKKDSGDKILL